MYDRDVEVFNYENDARKKDWYICATKRSIKLFVLFLK